MSCNTVFLFTATVFNKRLIRLLCRTILYVLGYSKNDVAFTDHLFNPPSTSSSKSSKISLVSSRTLFMFRQFLHRPQIECECVLL